MHYKKLVQFYQEINWLPDLPDYGAALGVGAALIGGTGPALRYIKKIHTKDNKKCANESLHMVPGEEINKLPSQEPNSPGLESQMIIVRMNFYLSTVADMSLSRSVPSSMRQRQMGASWTSDLRPSQHLPWFGGSGAVRLGRQRASGAPPGPPGPAKWGEAAGE